MLFSDKFRFSIRHWKKSDMLKIQFETTWFRLVESKKCSYVPNIKSIGWMVSNVEGKGPIDPPRHLFAGLVATKEFFFADFTSTGTLENHIKNVSKSTLGKLLKIVVLKHWVSYLHGNEAWEKLSTFNPTYNKNITEKLSTHITEIFIKQHFQFQSNVSCNFAKNQMAAKMAAKVAGILWKELLP